MHNTTPRKLSLKMTEVEVISTCLVKMANAITDEHTNGNISRLELTPWDLNLLMLDPIQKGVFFYKPQSPKLKQEFEEIFIDHLKNSFSRALDFFPPLAGRLAVEITTNNTLCFHVNCNNAGALFTHAIARGVHVSDILNLLHTPNVVRSFFPLNDVANIDGVTNPLLGVQVTEFVDGFFVGCTLNHSLGDGTSFWHFLNSWSEISRGLEKISKLPVFERSFDDILCLNLSIPIPPFEPKLKNKSLPQPLLERVFHFSEESIYKLKTMSNLEVGDRTSTISSFQALIAHVWRAVMRNRDLNSADEVSCLLVIGARTRLPLPDNYFGNPIYLVSVTTKHTNLMSKGLGWTAFEINKVVSTQTKDEVKRKLEDLVKNFDIHKPKGLMSKNTILISSSPRHNVYGVDFSWGKPVAVRSGAAQKYDGKITVFPTAKGRGIDVEACLAPDTLKALEDDAEFMKCVNL